MTTDTIIHCIDHEAAKNERFTFKVGNKVYTASIEYDADFDGEGYVACNSIGIVVDADGIVAEGMEDYDDLKEDMNEIISAIQDTEYGGYRFTPFEPLPEPTWPQWVYIPRKQVDSGELSVTVSIYENGDHEFVGQHKPTFGSAETLDIYSMQGLTHEQATAKADKMLAGYVNYHSESAA